MADEYKQLLEKVKKLSGLKRICQAVVKYNEFRDENSEQFLIRHDMFIKIKQKLEELT